MKFEELVKIVKDCGAVGAGGAGFPSYAKLDEKIEIVILNCAECEPLFKVHRQLLEQKAYEIVSTLDKISKALGAKQFIVAVKEKYKEAAEAVKSVLVDYENGKLSLLPEVYPMGDEVVLIYEATGRLVPPGNIPISIGVCVYNVETVYNIYNAVNNNLPVTHKYVTVCGEVKNPATYCVPVGTSFKALIELSGGETCDNGEILKGGPMTGKLASRYDVVTKNTNGVLVFPENHPVIMKRKSKVSINIARAKSVCCQCRMCTDLCPRNLLGMPVKPHALMDAVANGATHDAKAIADAMYCVSCGLCEMYSCTQGLAPRTIIDEFKAKMKASGVTIKRSEVGENNVSVDRKYRMVPMKRLEERLGLVKYDVPANIVPGKIDINHVKIMLSQSIGTPSVPCVNAGDKVMEGQIVANAARGLSLPIHASISGTVIDVTDKFIIIEKR